MPQTRSPKLDSYIELYIIFYASFVLRRSLLFHLVSTLGFTCFHSYLTAPAGLVKVIDMERACDAELPLLLPARRRRGKVGIRASQ